LYVATKKDGEAEKAFQRALSVYEYRSEKNDLVISSVLNGLAYIKARKHDYERAEPLLLRSLEIQEKQMGPTNPKTVEAMKNYACTDLMAREGRVPQKSDDPSKMAVKQRAICWLGGFMDNCADETQVIPGDVLKGKAIKLAFPPYPAAARGMHLSAIAFVAVLIDEVGNVIKARSVCGGHSDFNNVGVDAARLSTFSPTLVNQKPIKVTGVLVYNFIAQ
jgi:hypothetical protein